jgi:hypothetical protein
METPAALAISRMVARGLPLAPGKLMPLFKQTSVTVSNNDRVDTAFRYANHALISLLERDMPLDRSVTFW